jgi:succinate-semialdehyde dehydrogenase/glutarate-semialdehyde dehydrogenase
VLGELARETGAPPGVLTVITSSDPAAVTMPLLADPRLRKLSFTGSTPVGGLLLQQSGARVLRTSMELGGNAPFLVFDDADLDLAVREAMIAKMWLGGQSCVGANRFLVQEGIADAFAAAMAERMAAIRVGPRTGRPPGLVRRPTTGRWTRFATSSGTPWPVVPLSSPRRTSLTGRAVTPPRPC